MNETTNPTSKIFTLDLGNLFFLAANEHLRLGRPESGGRESSEVEPNPLGEKDDLESPWCCDAVSCAFESLLRNEIIEAVGFVAAGNARYHFSHHFSHAIKDVLVSEGMIGAVFGVFDHVEREKRQEARWFFLMMLARAYKGKTMQITIETPSNAVHIKVT